MERRWNVPQLRRRRPAARAGRSPTTSTAEPTRALWIVGVTGTNGKTSCTQWIAHALRALRSATAVIGTLGDGLFSTARTGDFGDRNTTPDAVLLQRTLAELGARARRRWRWKCRRIGLDQGA